MPEKPLNEAYESILHYTGGRGLHGILESKSLWATDYRFMNDKSEFETFVDGLEKCVEPKEKPEDVEKFRCLFRQNALFWKDHCAKHMQPYIVSFTPCIRRLNTTDKTKDEYEAKHGLLSQWRGYGKQGYAIEFDVNHLCKILNEEMAFQPQNESRANRYHRLSLSTLCYLDALSEKLELIRSDDQKGTRDALLAAYKELKDELMSQFHSPANMASRMQDMEVANKFTDNLFTCAARTKHFGFHEENEIRIIALAYDKSYVDAINPEPYPFLKRVHFRPLDNVPYIKLFEEPAFDEMFKKAVKRVIVGPGSAQVTHQLKVEQMLKEYGYRDVPVTCTNIPYVS